MNFRVDYTSVLNKDGVEYTSYRVFPGATLPTVKRFVRNPMAFRFSTIDNYTILKLKDGFLEYVTEVTYEKIVPIESLTGEV